MYYGSIGIVDHVYKKILENNFFSNIFYIIRVYIIYSKRVST